MCSNDYAGLFSLLVVGLVGVSEASAANVSLVGDLGVNSRFQPTQLHALAADGSKAVGSSFSTLGQEAFQWTPGGGIDGLGDLLGGSFRSLAFDTSADGSVIVGRATEASGLSGSGAERAFRWSPADDMTALRSQEPNVTTNAATRISRDGNTIYGTGTRRTGPGMLQAEPIGFRWTEATEAQALDGLYPDYDWLFPISPNDQMWAAYEDFPVAQRQYSILDMTGSTPQVVKQFAVFPTNAGFETPGMEVPAFATDDASIIVGRRLVENQTIGQDVWRSFIEQNGNRTYITDVDESSTVDAVTDDGQMVVGRIGSEGYVWTPQSGTRSLLDFLVNEHGLESELGDWTPYFFGLRVSADGTVIGGQGTDGELNTQIFVANLTGGLPGDYNDNGVVDAIDYAVWRDNLGSSTALPNDNTAGVGSDDLTRWRTQFGNIATTPGSSAGSASATVVVPEPGMLGYVITAAICALLAGNSADARFPVKR